MSFEQQPIVVDPNAATAPISVPADSPIETGSEVLLDGASAQGGGETPVADNRAWAETIARDFGFEAADLAAYPDEASARAAVRGYFDNLAKMGTGGAAPQQMPAPQPLPNNTGAALWQLDPNEFGLDADDPAFKAVAAYDKRMQQVVGALASHVAGLQQNTAEQSRMSLRGQINGAVDSFASPEFGTGENVSRFQEMNRERLFSIAGGIVAGCRATGRPEPSPRQLLSIAKFQYEQEKGIVSSAAPTATPNITTLAGGRSPGGAPGKANERVGMLAPWSQSDPAIKAFLAQQR